MLRCRNLFCSTLSRFLAARLIIFLDSWSSFTSVWVGGPPRCKILPFFSQRNRDSNEFFTVLFFIVFGGVHIPNLLLILCDRISSLFSFTLGALGILGKTLESFLLRVVSFRGRPQNQTEPFRGSWLWVRFDDDSGDRFHDQLWFFGIALCWKGGIKTNATKRCEKRSAR